MTGPDPRLAGLVLAGGRSRRFGSDKAVALLDARPLLAWTAEALAGACGAVAVSAPPGSKAAVLAETLGLPVLADPPGAPDGPLAGVAAGAAWAIARGAERLALLPCDTPRVDAAIIVRLAAALGPADGVAAARTTDGLHALCAVLRLDRVGALMETVAAGEHPPIAAIWARMGLRPVDFENAPAFLNLNRPEDLNRLLGASPSGGGGPPQAVEGAQGRDPGDRGA